MRSLYWKKGRLREHQNIELRKIINNAYFNVPFYNKLFKKRDLKPGDIKTVDDLYKIPVIRKNELREKIDETVSVRFNRGALIPHHTSGSTGEPFTVLFSQKEDDFRKAKHLRDNIACGLRPRDRWVTLTSPSHSTQVSEFHRLLNLYAPIYLSVFDSEDYKIDFLKRVKPDVLDSYQSSLLILANELEKREEKEIKPRFILSGAELLDEFSRGVIERALDTPIYDTYATIEVERIAWQCPEKNEYHMDTDAIVVQFVDENGEEVSEGERGEIICTSLFSYSMPFIRYSQGDIGIPSANICTCGITLPLMKIIEGRTDQVLPLPNGSYFSPRHFCLTMNSFELINYFDQFRVIQKKIDSFEFLIKMKNNQIEEKKMKERLADHIRKMLNLEDYNMTFEINFVNEIPLEKTGKLRAVVSELNTPRAPL